MRFSHWFSVWFEREPVSYPAKVFVLTRFSIIPGIIFILVFHALISVTGDAVPVVWHIYRLLLLALLVIWLAAGWIFFRYFFIQTRETLANAEVWDVRDRAEETAMELIRFPLKYVSAAWFTGFLFVSLSGLFLFWFREGKEERWILQGVLTTLMGLNLYAIVDYILLNRMVAPLLKWIDDKKFNIRTQPFQLYDEPFIVYAWLGLLTGCCFGLLMHSVPFTVYVFWWTVMIWAMVGLGLILIRHRQWLRFHQHLDTVSTNGRKIRAELLMPALWVLLQRVNTMKRLFYDLLLNIENNSSEMNAAARVVAETSTEQNAALVRQSASVTQTTSTLQELVQAAKQIAESSSAVVGFAESTQAKAEAGLQVMQNTVASVQKVRQENDTNLSEVIILSEAIIEIDQVLNFIISIADETNLIALNAAIEASSAGEQGKRFKTVANEVRNLSTRVTRSIRHVKETIRKIQEATARLVQTVQNHQEVIDESVDWVDQSLANLEEILENAVQSADAAKQIYIAIQQQKIANQQIASSFTDISNDIRQLASASERYNQYVSALKKFSANIDRALHDLQVDRIRHKEDEWLLS